MLQPQDGAGSIAIAAKVKLICQGSIYDQPMQYMIVLPESQTPHGRSSSNFGQKTPLLVGVSATEI